MRVWLDRAAMAARNLTEVVLTAAEIRLRPIVMTGVTTAAGAVPLILSSGPGAETRMVIGVVVLSGVLSATILTLFVVPAAYGLLSRRSGTPGKAGKGLEQELEFFDRN